MQYIQHNWGYSKLLFKIKYRFFWSRRFHHFIILYTHHIGSFYEINQIKVGRNFLAVSLQRLKWTSPLKADVAFHSFLPSLDPFSFLFCPPPTLSPPLSLCLFLLFFQLRLSLSPHYYQYLYSWMSFSCGLAGKESAWNAGDLGLIPG